MFFVSLFFITFSFQFFYFILDLYNFSFNLFCCFQETVNLLIRIILNSIIVYCLLIYFNGNNKLKVYQYTYFLHANTFIVCAKIFTACHNCSYSLYCLFVLVVLLQLSMILPLFWVCSTTKLFTDYLYIHVQCLLYIL